ncbi:MAG: hypothetical protein V4547_16535 [Bacteroidota bacterium]
MKKTEFKDRTWYINRADNSKIVQYFAEQKKGRGFYARNTFGDNIIMNRLDQWQEIITDAHKDQLENLMRAQCVVLGYKLANKMIFDRKFDVVTIDGTVVYKNGVWLAAAQLSVDKNIEFKVMKTAFETPVKMKGIFRDKGGMSKANSTAEQRRGIIGLLIYNQKEYDVNITDFLKGGKYSGVEALQFYEASNYISTTIYHEDIVAPLTYEEVLFKIQQINSQTLNVEQ